MARNWASTSRRRRALLVVDGLLAPLALFTRLRRRRPVPAAPRILVLEFWRLGDAVMVEPLLRELRSRFPAGEISLLCTSGARVLLEPGGAVDRFVEIDVPWTAFEGKYQLKRYIDSRFLATIRQLRKSRFDVSIDSRMDLRSNVLAWLIGAGRRIGFDVPGGRGLLTDRVADPGESSHKVLDWLAMLEPLGGHTEEPTPPQLTVRPETQERVDGHLRGLGIDDAETIIAVQPSARQAVRQWPLERFQRLVEELVEIPGITVLVLVDPDGYGETVKAPGSVCVKATLEELPAFLARASVFVGNDSGPAHIAAASGTTTVTIFGPGAIEWFRPFGPGHRVVHVEPMPCRPCFDRCIHPTNICLQRLTVDMVLTVVHEVLWTKSATLGNRGDDDAVHRVDGTTATGEIGA